MAYFGWLIYRETKAKLINYLSNTEGSFNAMSPNYGQKIL